MPVLTVVAGPNGSGKSSVIKRVQFEGRDNMLETDSIAKRMSSADARGSAILAAREVLRRTQEFIEVGERFAIETTLAGTGRFQR